MTPHTVTIFDFSAPDGPEIIDWEPEGIPDSAGIHDVVRLLLAFRTFVRDKRTEFKRAVTTLAAVSDENASCLLRLAYRASFQTDEGRPIRTRIAVPREDRWWASDTSLEPEQAAIGALHTAFAMVLGGLGAKVEDAQQHTYRFQKPQPLEDHKLLVKLAPLLPERDGVFAVRQVDGGLSVTGMGLLDQEDRDGGLFHMPGLWQPSGGLLVEIVGPGHLRVTEGAATFTLAADRLVARRRALDVPLVERWLAELSRGWVAEFQTDHAYRPNVRLFRAPRKGADPAEERAQLDVYVAVARILRSAVALGHGGAFAILPDVEAAPLSLTYPVNPVILGAELRQVWRTHCEVLTAGQDATADHAGVAEVKRVAVNRWLSRLASVGQLSAADGCVVFDRRLVLRGFGGSIKKNFTEVDWGICHDLTDGTDVPAAALLKSFGERHKSAFELCRKVPNAIVFVVSQDGDLRVFASDADGRVFFASNLSA